MTRGKYAAKAANRLADLDNQLVQEKVGEVAQLKAQIAELQSLLDGERLSRQAMIIDRGNELSAQQIAAVRQRLDESVAHHAETLRDVATHIGELFLQRGYASVDYITKILPELLPDATERSNHIAKYHMSWSAPNRRDRRQIATALDHGLAAKTNEE